MSHTHTHDKLVMMANQIGTFFSSQGGPLEVTGVTDHIRKFWDPRMRRGILEHLDAGGSGLRENVRLALIDLRKNVDAEAVIKLGNVAEGENDSEIPSED